MKPDPLLSRWRIATFALTWVTYASFYLARKSLAVAKVALEEAPRSALQITREQFGIIDSIYLGAYALGQFVGGGLTDRFGARRILITGLILVIISSVFLGFATGLVVFTGLLIVHGLGQSAGWPSSLKTMSQWFSSKERGRIMGWWCTSYTVGAAVAAPFVAWCMVSGNFLGGSAVSGDQPYWPAGFWGPALVLSVIVALVALFLKNTPQEAGLSEAPPIVATPSTGSTNHPRKPLDNRTTPWQTILCVISQPAVWMLAFSYFSIKLTRYGFYFWGPKYVHETLGTGTMASALTSAALPVGGIFGVLTTGYISDRWFQSRRAPVAVLSLVLAVATLASSQILPIRNETSMALFFALVGFFIYGPDALLSASAAMDIGTRSGAGTSTGFVNGVGSIGAVLGALLPGLLTTAEHWEPAFYIFTGGLMVSALVILPLWNKQPPE